MTRYFTQWDEDTIGSTIAGWTHRTAGTAPTYVPAYGTPAVKRRYLAHTPGTTSDLRGLITWDSLDADANRDKFDLVTCIQMDAWTGDYADLWARVAITGTTITDGYRIRVIRAGGASNIRMDKRVASVTTTGIGTATVTMSAGKSYFVRFQGNGTALKCRVWDAALGMSGEPTAWDISITDSGVAAAGYIGLASVSSSTSHVCPFNFFAVGTNGDAAVAPWTNAEFLTWIEKPNKRCILAEMQATGYDSSGSPYTKTIKAYVSNMGFTSAQQDTPSLQHYDAYIAQVPTFSRQMAADLAGPVSVGFGDLVLKNAASAPRINTAGYAVQCDGVDDYVNVPDSTSLHQGTGSLTYECWVTILSYPPSGKLAGVMAKGTGTGRIWIYLDGTTQKMAFNNYFGGAFDYYVTPAAPSAGRHHVALVVDRDAGMQYAYIDGVQVGSNNVSAAAAVAFDAVSALKFGGTISASTYGNIVVDEARVWNVARNAGQIAKYMNRRAVGNETGLVSAWHFDEGTGTSAVDANTTNANTGTLNGGATWIAGAQLFPWSDDVKGRLDDWLRVRWSRNYLRMWIGDPGQPRHNFRALITGRLGQPTAPTMDTLKFPIADVLDALNAPVTALFTSGSYNNQRKPKLFGQPIMFEPPQTDSVNQVYTVDDGSVTSVDTVFDNNVAIEGVSGLTVSAANNVNGDITASAAHGMVPNYRVRFTSGTPPFGLALGTDYYVIAAGWTTTVFRLATTVGGSAITGGAASTGAAFTSYGWYATAGSGTFTLAAAPAGRVTCQATDTAGNYASDMIAEVAFTALGMSLNFKDSTSFQDLRDYHSAAQVYGGMWMPPGGFTGMDAVTKLAVGFGLWFGVSFDGLMQLGRVKAPASTATKSLTTSNISLASMKLLEVRRPVDFSASQITYRPWFLTGAPLQSVNQEAIQGKTYMAPSSYGAAGIPLDDHPDQWDSEKTRQYDTLLTNSTGMTFYQGTLVALYKYRLGIIEFKTTLGSIWHANGPLSIGDTISLEHPRLGWKQYTSADPASPDNTATIDARLAVVMGMDVNLSAPAGQQVTLKVFRQIPGYFPTANLN